MQTIGTIEELEALYGATNRASIVKETRHITAHYRAMIEASPFVALATVGPEGIDCSPHGEDDVVSARPWPSAAVRPT